MRRALVLSLLLAGPAFADEAKGPHTEGDYGGVIPGQPKKPEPAKGKPKRPPFNKPEVLLQWINEYRHNPEPERLAEAYKAMRDLNLLKDVEAAGIYVGFIAGVIGANPDTAEKLVGDMFPMPPQDQVIVVKAIAFSGLAEWKELLGKFA